MRTVIAALSVEVEQQLDGPDHRRAPSLAGSPSYLLHARPQDDRGMWPAYAGRCRRALPQDLEGALALLDVDEPRPVLCTHAQAQEPFRWLDARPNTDRVSVVCERRRRPGELISSL